MCKVGSMVMFVGHIRGPALPGLRQASPKSSASILNMHALNAHLTL